MRIARKLDEIGISEIEAGMPASSAEDREAICEMVQAGLKARITALARPSKDDIDMVADCGVMVCNPEHSYWGSAERIQARLGR